MLAAPCRRKVNGVAVAEADRPEGGQSSRGGTLSIDDVERVPKCLVERGSRDLVEATHGLILEGIDGNGDDVVAADDARHRKAVIEPDLDFRVDAADSAGDRRARDGAEDTDRGVSGEDTHWAAPGRGPEVRPEDVVAGYHAGVVWAASCRADWISAGSSGWRR